MSDSTNLLQRIIKRDSQIADLQSRLAAAETRIKEFTTALAAAKEALESCHCCDGANGVTSNYDSRAVANALARIAECEKA
jgi:hypothetical protein